MMPKEQGVESGFEVSEEDAIVKLDDSGIIKLDDSLQVSEKSALRLNDKFNMLKELQTDKQSVAFDLTDRLNLPDADIVEKEQ